MKTSFHMHSLNITRCIKLNDRADDIIHRIEVWWVWWPHVWCHGLSFTNVCMRVHDIDELRQGRFWRGWSSRWLMTQLTNDKCACVLVFMPVVDILNILCDYQFVFSVLDELYFSHHPWLMQCVIFKECIIKVWNMMFSFSLGSVNTLFRWGGHFCHICVKQFFLLTTVQQL